VRSRILASSTTAVLSTTSKVRAVRIPLTKSRYAWMTHVCLAAARAKLLHAATNPVLTALHCANAKIMSLALLYLVVS
jgi:hypothetical protein